MKKIRLVLLFMVSISAFGQQTIVKGSVKDATSFKPLVDVLVKIEGTDLSTKTDVLGEFDFSSNLPLGEQVLNISKEGYVATRYPITINAFETVNITDM